MERSRPTAPRLAASLFALLVVVVLIQRRGLVGVDAVEAEAAQRQEPAPERGTPPQLDQDVLEHVTAVVRDGETRLIQGRIGPQDVLGLLTEVLDLYGPASSLSKPGEGWTRYQLAAGAELGTITLSIGPPEPVRPVVLLIQSEEAPYLAESLGVLDSQFKLYVGLGPDRIEYCASSLHARVHPTSEVVERLEGREPLRIGATYELRAEGQKWSEVLLEVGELPDGRPTTTSRKKPPEELGEVAFASLPELPHLNQMLRSLAGD